MKVKDIIELACVFTNKQDLLETSLFDQTKPAPTTDEQKEIDLFTRCLNLIIGEISCDYIPLVITEEIEVKNGVFEFENLSKIAVEILSIKDKSGNLVKAKIYPAYTYLDNGKYTIEYSYVPDLLSFEDDVPSFYCRLHERVFAYGVAMEYCLLCSLYDEMQIWQTRFKDSLQIAMQKRSEKRLPKRRWF